MNIACGFLYGLVYGVIFIILYASIGLSVSFYLCRFILTHNYCVIKNLKTTLENSEIIQTIIKVLNCPDGYKIIFLSRLTPVIFLPSFFDEIDRSRLFLDSSWFTKWILLHQ